jgi:DNA sulfur modification protein DndD
MPEGFILMDTPFGSLDMGHREEVCKWASTSGLRVSLFMHSGEFDRTIDSKFFGNSIGRVYRIRQIDENESTIEVEN